MKADFWHQRWQDNQIGFHQESITPRLQALRRQLNLPAGTDLMLEMLISRDCLDASPRFRDRGLSRLIETAYSLQRG